MRKSFKYRIYPTRAQADAMAQMLETHRRLYNDALAERKATYEQEQRIVKYGEQSAQLKATRQTNPFLAQTNFSSCQATLRRLDKAFQAFFRRVKAGEKKVGYPRFKGRHRFDTVEFPAYGDGCKLDGMRVYFQHVGSVKVKLHRPVEGCIKTVSFKREPDGWHVVFSCELPDVELTTDNASTVGIDMGLQSFLVTSDGEKVEPPKFYRRAQGQLRKAQRVLSRRQKGSHRRHKARQRVAKLHQHIANQRKDFHHKTARALVNRYGTVVHEALNVKGIARTRLAKSTQDAGWAQFLSILASKAVEAGSQVVAVNPRNTSQVCSECGALPDVPKTLSVRVHQCPHCGYTADRDLNAARNIHRLGRSRQALTWPNGACVA
jgi:putative transposase